MSIAEVSGTLTLIGLQISIRVGLEFSWKMFVRKRHNSILRGFEFGAVEMQVGHLYLLAGWCAQTRIFTAPKNSKR